MAEIVYALCALTSMVCSILLVRAYRRSRVRLLLWSAVGFIGLALNNVGLFVDVVLLPTSVNLSIIRTIPAVIGMFGLVCALVWEEL